MKSFTPKSTVTQLIDYLRELIISGAISNNMPGVNHIVREHGLGTKTVVAAIAALEKEGLLESGVGPVGRKIIKPSGKGTERGLKVQILLYEQSDAQKGYLVDLRYQLQEAGHAATFASHSLTDLGMDEGRVARYVKKCEVDAWIILAGSRPILEWFASQSFPSFALFGRGVNVDIDGLTFSKVEAISEIIRQLVNQGHRRIVMVTREDRRKPEPGLAEKHFLAELAGLGIPVGTYNLPDWENNPTSFQICLSQLFKHTPPSAIFFDEPMLYFGAQTFFNRQRIRIPDDLSVSVLDGHPNFEWCSPMPTHISVDPALAVRKIMSWIQKISQGGSKRSKTIIKAKVIEGGTIAATKN